MIHASAGTLVSSLNWLCNPVARVSAHYVIAKTGVLYQLVAETESAWHAGDAIWQGETAINELSLGIELVNATGMRGFTGQDPYPAVQIGALTDLARGLMRRFPGIAFARHMDVALPKGRKTDPAGFDWTRWKASLALDPHPPPTHPTPPPASRPHRVIGLPVYQRSDRTGALWGHLSAGEQVAIDDPINGHLSDGRGFVDQAGLETI